MERDLESVMPGTSNDSVTNGMVISNNRDDSGKESNKQLKLETPALEQIGSSNNAVLDRQGIFLESNAHDMSSYRYIGVALQRNGRWAAKIYHQKTRLWLGSFSEDAEAARAYDVAAQYFHGRDAFTNFKTLYDETEQAFHKTLPISEMVDMLRNHSYDEELAQYEKSRQINDISGVISSSTKEHLFDKIVTACDLKWKRFAVPRMDAQKLSPLLMSPGGGSKRMLLNFEDDNGKVWRFQFSCSKRKEYFLNKGWSRFACDKSLNVGDIVSFYCSTELGAHKKLFIQWQRRKPVDPLNGTEHLSNGTEHPSIPPETGIRLFGVNITVKSSTSNTDEHGSMIVPP